MFLYAALLKTANSSDVFMIWNIADKHNKFWPEFAAHLGCSRQYIQTLREEWKRGTAGKEFIAVLADGCHRKCLVNVITDWAGRNEGTGNRPRTWKTVLQVMKACCIHSKEALSRVSDFESRLIAGADLYTLP